MKIHELDVIIYDENGQSWHEEKVPQPTWTAIEVAVRRMDRFQYPILNLRLTPDSDIPELNMLGGNGAYHLAVTIQGYHERRVYFSEKEGDVIDIWESDQGFETENNYLIEDLDLALSTIQYFCEHTDFAPFVPWES